MHMQPCCRETHLAIPAIPICCIFATRWVCVTAVSFRSSLPASGLTLAPVTGSPSRTQQKPYSRGAAADYTR